MFFDSLKMKMERISFRFYAFFQCVKLAFIYLFCPIEEIDFFDYDDDDEDNDY